MIVLAEMNSIAKGISDNQKKMIASLSAKDKFFILCDKNSSVAMNVLQVFMELKVKPQFIEIEGKDKFALGFQYGLLAATYGKEKILVISEEDRSAVFTSNMENANSVAGKKTGTKAPAKTVAKATEKAPAKAPAKATEKAPAKAPAKTTEKAPVKTPKKTPAKDASDTKPDTSKSRVRLKDLSNASLCAKYPGLQAYKDLIDRMGDGMLRSAIEKATDADPGLKLQLVMTYGAEVGEGIFSILKKDFAKLKELS